MLGTFFVFTTPQYLYYIVPLAVLLASLVTVAILTKNSELVVMKGVRHQPVPLRGADGGGGRCGGDASSSPWNRPSSVPPIAVRGPFVTSSTAGRPKRSTC